MNIAASVLSAFVAGTITASAFVAPHSNAPLACTRSSDVAIKTGSSVLKSMSDELDIPCEDECAMEKYPDLPESVHPGVLSGQAMVDLLEHAKENGTFRIPGLSEFSRASFLDLFMKTFRAATKD